MRSDDWICSLVPSLIVSRTSLFIHVYPCYVYMCLLMDGESSSLSSLSKLLSFCCLISRTCKAVGVDVFCFWVLILMFSSLLFRFTSLKGIHIWNVHGTAAQESLKANNTEIFGNGDSGMAGTDVALGGPRQAKH
mmetsp:Transcript_53364/g.141439  ORF Transcript_53364/g.141439 Transcript_53364/m.141439 type:complete len:135 (+) Transcript_53364:28-432(+)